MTLIEARAESLGNEGPAEEGNLPGRRAAPAHAADILTLSVPLREILNAAISGLIVMDEDGIVCALNRPALAMFGYDAPEIVGRSFSVLMPESQRVRHDRVHREYFAGRGAVREVSAVRKDGTQFPVDLGINELAVGNRRLLVALLRDQTPRKAAETEREERFVAELTRSNAELARFAYVASHDLQEPLRMIGSYLELLSSRYGDKLDTDAQEFIAFAVDGAARMKRLITDLLDYSRIGSTSLSVAPVDVGALVASVAGSLGLLLEECGGRVVAGELPTIVADPGQLTRVFQNLIENAIKYRGESPPVVDVSARHAGRFWRFDVVDNGIGVDPRFSNKIFEIFQRLHTRGRYQGTGIGLAVTRLAVERHGGTVWVEPVATGGSRFSFTIPERPA